jgi:ABC-type transport system involved in Fe-S cluster assembly fused permease/ATPase subunit
MLKPIRQLSFNGKKMSFSQVQGVFIVEHYLASHSNLICQNASRDTFHNSHLPNKSTVSRLVNRFRDTGSVQDRNRSVASNMRKTMSACIAESGGHFQHLILHCFCFLISM